MKKRGEMKNTKQLYEEHTRNLLTGLPLLLHLEREMDEICKTKKPTTYMKSCKF